MAVSRTPALGFSCPLDEHTEPRQAWAAYFSVLYGCLRASAPTTGRVDNLPGGYALGGEGRERLHEYEWVAQRAWVVS